MTKKLILCLALCVVCCLSVNAGNQDKNTWSKFWKGGLIGIMKDSPSDSHELQQDVSAGIPHIEIGNRTFLIEIDEQNLTASICDDGYKIDDAKHPIHNDTRKFKKVKDKTVEIPDRYKAPDGKEYLITTIGRAAFAGYQNVKRIIIPTTVTVIEDYAFFNTSLESVTVPASVVKMGKRVFGKCPELNALRVPEHITLQSESYSESEDVTVYSYKSQSGTVPEFEKYMTPLLDRFKESWRQKKTYETDEEYSSRIKEKTEKEISKKWRELKDEYIQRYAPKPHELTYEIKSYDEYYGIYTIRMKSSNKDYGEVFAKVPADDKDSFKDNFYNSSKMKVGPVFDVIDDTLRISNCKFSLGDKEFSSIPYTALKEDSHGEVKLLSDSNGQLVSVHSSTSVSDINKTKTSSKKDNHSKAKAASDSSTQLDPKYLWTNSDVDNKIPKGSAVSNNTFALIFGNEKYTKGTGDAKYAEKDAIKFEEYCQKTLGIPEKNIVFSTNASKGTMQGYVELMGKMVKLKKNNKPVLIVYYAGHGMPNNTTHEPYLMPVDASSSGFKSQYKLSEFYDDLAEIPSDVTLVLLDACFSGTTREATSMQADGRAPAVEVNNSLPDKGNLMVLSACQGNQTAHGYAEKGHGMFTYFLLKYLKTAKGKKTITGLKDFVIKNVQDTSINVNQREQVPTFLTSPSMADKWKNLPLTR